MIKKLDIIEFGLFSDYLWSQNVGNDYNFNKVNIIYGRNYSGKTTLSRIFRCLEKKELHGNYSNGRFTLTSNDNKTVTQDNLAYSANIRVYNSDFVKDNLSWLHDDENGEISPFTLLGSGNVDAQPRIDKINEILGNVEQKVGLLYQSQSDDAKLKQERLRITAKQEDLNGKLREKANRGIKINHYFVKQGSTYNVSTIQNEIDEIILNLDNFKLKQERIDLLKKQIDESEKKKIAEISNSKPNLSNYIERVKLLAEKKITISNTISELIQDSILQDWVDKGREQHRGKRDTCAFCGGHIDSKRWEELDAHFSKESETLKKEILEEIKKLDIAKESINNFLENRELIQSNFYASVLPEFDLIIVRWNNVIGEYNNSINQLRSKLQERYDDIFSPKDLTEIVDPSDKLVDIIKLFNELINKNDLKTASLVKDKDIARKELRYSEISNFLKLIDYIKIILELSKDNKEYLILEDEFKKLKKQIENLEDEKKLKELELKDEGEAAKKVNSHLSNFFGHNGILLDPEIINDESPKTKFVVKRGTEKAHNLSEGECSLISFCYFIAKMEDELKGAECDKLMIYIDDPISSLDNNHIFFMYSLIETVIAKEQKYGQLFISTHNLDFLKYIKRLTLPFDENRKPLISHFIVEKKKKGIESKCIIKIMPSYLKDYVTEYNFLFEEIYKIAKPFVNGNKAKLIENQFTHFYNLPNNMRKFLECYLFYRYPNTDDPLKNISKLFDGNVPCLLNRVINEYSHLSWGNRGTLVLDVSEAEDIAAIILNMIKTKDPEHYNALCASIAVDSSIELSINTN
jgi:wobble nucleotide-excising tRNase